MTKLDDQLREFYNGSCLCNHRTEAILHAGQACSLTCKVIRRGTFVMAASIIIMATLHFAFPEKIEQPNVERIAAVVAGNHTSQLDPEFSSRDYVELQNRLARADFNIRPDKAFLQDEYSLVGGRYCSLNTCLAVQLRLEHNQTGERVTLYVAKLQPQLGDIDDDVKVVNGIRVQVWKNTDRLFVMASGGPQQISRL